jgi:competence protein CoiA
MAKLALRDAFAAHCVRTELEWELPWIERPLDSVEDLPADYGGDRRADLVVWSPKNRPIAIELQHSAITLNHLERRAFSYAAAGVAQIWLPFLEADLLATASERPGGKDGNRHIACYRAPRWQRWLHGYNFGELWFYDGANSALWRGHLLPHHTAISPQNSLEKSLDDGQHGALESRRQSKRWRDLTLWGPYRTAELRIDLGYRAAAELGGYRYPAGPTARFVAPVPTVAASS